MKVRKVIAIGETSYNVIFQDGVPQRGFPGGRILNASASLAKAGIPSTFVSECGNDFVGDLVVDFLRNAGVNTNSIDRFSDGTTCTVFEYGDRNVHYGRYPMDRFNVVWPRIDEDDIVIFGALYAADEPQRQRLFEIIRYAQERKAIILYMPGFYYSLNFGITKIMTAILENLEVTNIVLADSRDIKNIFGDFTGDKVYREKIKFYCPNFVYLDDVKSATVYTATGEIKCSGEGNADRNSLAWCSGFIAGLVYGIFANEITYDELNGTSVGKWDEIIKIAYRFGEASGSDANIISEDFVKFLK